MEYNRSVISQDQSITAGAVTTYDLPVNPLSHLVFTFRCLNVTDEATRAEILARISRVEVLHRGAAIFSLSGADLFALNAVMFGKMPVLINQVATDNAHRAITLVIPFGRKQLDPNECFPATQKGELQLQITLSSTETACDNVRYQIEAVEMFGAKPKGYMKVTSLSRTPSATGDLDVDLPIANDMLGLLLFGTTIVSGTTDTNTIEQVKFLVDNRERNVSLANWEALHGDMLSRAGHQEQYDGSADNDDIANYAIMDFDPNGDGQFAVPTKGAASVKLRVTAGDTNVLRVLPLEMVKV